MAYKIRIFICWGRNPNLPACISGNLGVRYKRKKGGLYEKVISFILLSSN